MTDIDVVIIGAGPAGSAAAIMLARAGRHVMLIDRKHFPREKVCGGCLSGTTVQYLQKLLGNQYPLPGIPGTRVTFVIGTYRLKTEAAGKTRIVHRAELDTTLVEAARNAGAQCHFGEAATLVPSENSGNNKWQVQVGDQRIQSPIILLATGVAGLAARIDGQHHHAHRRLLAQQWIQPTANGLPSAGEVELHWLRGGYVGLTSPRQGECVVALAAEVPERTGEHAFDQLRRLNPNAGLWSMISADAPKRFNAKGAAGFPWFPRCVGDGNLLLIGDAVGYQEPCTGEGIGQAFCSAECATRAILAGEPILDHYRSLLQQHHRPLVRRTRIISRLLQSAPIYRLASLRPILPTSLLARAVRHVHVKVAL